MKPTHEPRAGAAHPAVGSRTTREGGRTTPPGGAARIGAALRPPRADGARDAGAAGMQRSPTQRRTSPRVEMRLPVVVAHGSADVRGTTVDIGAGGMAIECEEPIPFGAELTVCLRLPGLLEDAALPATVRWTRGTTIGVQLGLLGARQTWALNQLLRSAAATGT